MAQIQQQQEQNHAPLSHRGPGTTALRPELHNLKVIGVEEHIAFPQLIQRVPKDNHSSQVFASRMATKVPYPIVDYAKDRATDAGELRVKDMDECGIAVQILSLAGAVNSTHLGAVDAQAGIYLAQDINNNLKEAVDSNPTRFRALAELPLHDPLAAVKELHRCVKELGFVGAMLSGSVGGTGKFLDSSDYDVVLSAFEELDVPLFLHPGVPPKSVFDTYYSFPENPGVSTAFALAGWGWHNDAAIHVLRLALSGALDKHRRLKVVTGHLGEMMPMMMQRFDTILDERVFGFGRSIGEMLRSQVWISISGMYSLPPTLLAIATWGVDRVLFANDYPFINMDGAQDYLRALGDHVPPSDMRKICQTNAEELFKIAA